MSLRTVRDNAILFSILLFIFASVKQKLPLCAACAITVFWYCRFRLKGIVYLILCIFLLVLPRTYTGEPEIREASVIRTGSGYALLRKGMTNLIVYTQDVMPLDAEVTFAPDFRRISLSSGFFRTSSDSFLGAYYSIDSSSVIQIREKDTVRRRIQKRIGCCPQEEQTYLYRFLLNMRYSEEDSYLAESGFSVSGIISALLYLLKYFLDERKRQICRILLACMLCVFYGFPLLPAGIVLFALLEKAGMQKAERTGAGLSILILLYPHRLFSLAFLVPAVFRIGSCLSSCSKYDLYAVSMGICSLFTQCMEPLKVILFSSIRMICGILWIISWIALMNNSVSFVPVYRSFDAVLSGLDRFRLSGSIAGIGLPFFIACALLFPKSRYCDRMRLMLLVLFQLFSLFHPLAEVTFINVGQGDSILIRLPLNTENILVDTGKPSRYDAVDTFLKGKGIRRIDTLVITHADSDHSGNMERVMKDYHVNNMISGHTPEIHAGKLVMYDLNDIESEDENRNSIVLYFCLGGLSFILTGDADSAAEERIVSRFPSLSCDVLKLSHHGSATGSCDRFLDALRPRIGIVSSGAYSIYHHPSPETVQKMLKRHIPYFDTKTEGDISVLIFPFFNLLVTSSGKIAIMNPL